MAVTLKSEVAEWYNDPVSKDKIAGKCKIKILWIWKHIHFF